MSHSVNIHHFRFQFNLPPSELAVAWKLVNKLRRATEQEKDIGRCFRARISPPYPHNPVTISLCRVVAGRSITVRPQTTDCPVNRPFRTMMMGNLSQRSAAYNKSHLSVNYKLELLFPSCTLQTNYNGLDEEAKSGRVLRGDRVLFSMTFNVSSGAAIACLSVAS